MRRGPTNGGPRAQQEALAHKREGARTEPPRASDRCLGLILEALSATDATRLAIYAGTALRVRRRRGLQTPTTKVALPRMKRRLLHRQETQQNTRRQSQ